MCSYFNTTRKPPPDCPPPPCPSKKSSSPTVLPPSPPCPAKKTVSLPCPSKLCFPPICPPPCPPKMVCSPTCPPRTMCSATCPPPPCSPKMVYSPTCVPPDFPPPSCPTKTCSECPCPPDRPLSGDFSNSPCIFPDCPYCPLRVYFEEKEEEEEEEPQVKFTPCSRCGCRKYNFMLEFGISRLRVNCDLLKDKQAKLMASFKFKDDGPLVVFTKGGRNDRKVLYYTVRENNMFDWMCCLKLDIIVYLSKGPGTEKILGYATVPMEDMIVTMMCENKVARLNQNRKCIDGRYDIYSFECGERVGFLMTDMTFAYVGEMGLSDLHPATINPKRQPYKTWGITNVKFCPKKVIQPYGITP